MTPKSEKKESNKGEIKLHNLSPKGCSFASPLHLPEDKNWYITIEVTLNKEPMLLSGHIVWKKSYGSSTYIYGFKFDEDHDYAGIITAEIKEYASNMRKRNKE